jgi:uncharacterized DUF497 family protein
MPTREEALAELGHVFDTRRDGGDTIRIVSARKGTRREQRQYFDRLTP